MCACACAYTIIILQWTQTKLPAIFPDAELLTTSLEAFPQAAVVKEQLHSMVELHHAVIWEVLRNDKQNTLKLLASFKFYLTRTLRLS